MWNNDAVFVLIGPAVSVWLIWILIRRHLYREFPWFFGYLSVVIFVSGVRFWAIHGDYVTFYKIFWFSEGVYALLALLALHEAFRCVFSEFYEIWSWFWLVFPSAVGVLAFIKVIEGLNHPPVPMPRIVALVLSIAATVNWVQVALFVVMCMLVWLVGNWEYYPVGIVTGFAILALGSWAALASVSVFGTKFSAIGKYGLPLAYFIAVLVWVRTFIRKPNPERWEQWKKVTPEQMLAEINGYLKILKGKRSKE
ncbi:MAG TPA: hypothetical protein VFR24_04815 [Candidatus Angelobacter sp.]|nr:hypothetical protein [Candidatus Angelobacter sp.]